MNLALDKIVKFLRVEMQRTATKKELETLIGVVNKIETEDNIDLFSVYLMVPDCYKGSIVRILCGVIK